MDSRPDFLFTALNQIFLHVAFPLPSDYRVLPASSHHEIRYVDWVLKHVSPVFQPLHQLVSIDQVSLLEWQEGVQNGPGPLLQNLKVKFLDCLFVPLQLVFIHLRSAGDFFSTPAFVFQEFDEIRHFATCYSNAKVDQGLHGLRLPSVEVALNQRFALICIRGYKFIVAFLFIVLLDGFRNVVWGLEHLRIPKVDHWDLVVAQPAHLVLLVQDVPAA